jgi:hypothetical protein
MCDAITESGGFDPRLCPILQGLTDEEIAARLQADLRLARCIEAKQEAARSVATGGQGHGAPRSDSGSERFRRAVAVG